MLIKFSIPCVVTRDKSTAPVNILLIVLSKFSNDIFSSLILFYYWLGATLPLLVALAAVFCEIILPVIAFAVAPICPI